MIRYFLAFATVAYHPQRVFSLALGIVSAVAIAVNIISATSPLFHSPACAHSRSHTRSLLRTCYLLLILSASAINLALITIWRPDNRCTWDIDISWYLSTMNTPSTRCNPASFTVWIIAAALRFLLISILIVLFMCILRAYHTTRHPSHRETQRRPQSHRPTMSLSDAENSSPTETSQPSSPSLLTPKRTFSFSAFIRPSHKQLRQSSSTLAPSNSSGTLVPSLSHTGAVQSSPPKNTSSAKYGMPPAYRQTNGWFINGGIPSGVNQKNNAFNSNHGFSIRTGASDRSAHPYSDGIDDEAVFYATSQKQQVEEAMTPKPRVLRRTSRLSDWQRPADVTHLHDLSKARATSAAYEYDSDVDSTSSCDQTSERVRDPSVLAYAYGYGAPGPSYPYLDVYNPPASTQHSVTSSSASAESTQDTCSDRTGSDASDGEYDREEEFVPMMGRYVRRMETIESMGSREASTLGGAKSLRLSNAGSRSPSLMIGSVSSCMGGLPPSNGSPLQLSLSPAPSASITLSNSVTSSGSGTGKSRSTAYLSLSGGSSNGGTGIEAASGMGTKVRVTERGEFVISPDNASGSGASSPTSYGRRYWTASSGQSAQSGQNLPPTMEGGY
ncbi:hypothetical protein V8B97DRAFT_1870698 [Scleroderma yunnanense]